MYGLRQVSFRVDDFNRGVNEFGIAGSWWTRPHNRVSNTAIAFTGIIAVTAMVWTVSVNNEVRVCFVCVGLGCPYECTEKDCSAQEAYSFYASVCYCSHSECGVDFLL